MCTCVHTNTHAHCKNVCQCLSVCICVHHSPESAYVQNYTEKLCSLPGQVGTQECGPNFLTSGLPNNARQRGSESPSLGLHACFTGCSPPWPFPTFTVPVFLTTSLRPHVCLVKTSVLTMTAISMCGGHVCSAIVNGGHYLFEGRPFSVAGHRSYKEGHADDLIIFIW